MAKKESAFKTVIIGIIITVLGSLIVTWLASDSDTVPTGPNIHNAGVKPGEGRG